MKHLILRAIQLFGTDQYAVQVLEQTHIKSDFGSDGKDSFEASNGFRLYSDSYPKFYEFIKDHYLYVRGDDIQKNNIVFLMPLDKLDKLKVAVSEYNDHFAYKEENITFSAGEFIIE